jgi:hypothetical protein
LYYLLLSRLEEKKGPRRVFSLTQFPTRESSLPFLLVGPHEDIRAVLRSGRADSGTTRAFGFFLNHVKYEKEIHNLKKT